MVNEPDGAIEDDSKASSRSLRAVLTVQTQNAFNDNVVRYALLGVALVVLAEGTWMHDYYKNIIGGLISLPFVLFAPIAGWVSDRYPKSAVIKTCLYFQIGIIGLIVVAMLVKSIWLATAGFFILAIQSAFFGPAKFGIIKELVGSRRLTQAAGLMQMFTILAIVIGAVAGGEGVKQAITHVSADPWIAGLVPIGIIGVFSFIALWVVRGLSPTPAYPTEPLSPGIFFGHFKDVSEIFRTRKLGMACLGISFFWFSGAFAMAAFIQVAQENYSGATAAAFASYYLATTSLGIAAGSVFVSIISSNRIELGMVPLGGLGLGLSVLLCAVASPQTALFYVGLFALGATSAIFLVPQNAYLQDNADPERKGRILAASNLVNSMASLTASWVAQPGLQALGLSSGMQFLLLGLVSLGVGIYALRLLPMDFIRVFLKMLVRAFYRIRVVGEQNLPQKGGALLISNHVTWIDALLIGAAAPREVRFVCYEGFFKPGLLGKVLKLFKVIPISATQARKAIKQTAAGVNEGSLVCLFPEGTLTRTGTLSELQKGFELIARQAHEVPVIPVRLDRAWGSIFSFADNKFFKKKPRRIPYPLTVAFGEPVAQKATSEHVRDEMMRLSVTAYAERTELRTTLGGALVKALKRGSGQQCVVDRSEVRRVPFTRRMVLTSALGLAKRWRSAISSSTVAVAMPPSSASVLTHAGLALSGKTIVNLPLEVHPDDVAKLRQALVDVDVDTVITTKAFHEALPHLPWPNKVIYMSDELNAVQSTGRFLARLRVALIPTSWLQRGLAGGDSESSGLGVLVNDAGADEWHYRLMTHREVLTVAAQVADTNVFHAGDDTLLNAYPLHCLEGQIFGVWLPLLHELSLVVPTMGSKRATPETLIGAEKVTAVVADASGVQALESALADVRMIVTFDTAGSFAPTDQLYRGCCSSRTGVIWSMSMPDAESGGVKHIGNREGALGRLLPGLVMTGEGTPEEPGVLQGIWSSSLDHATKIQRHGWLDSDGFLYLNP